MKNKFKYRKQFEAIAERIGLFNETHLTGQRKPGLEEGFFILVNNKKRFVKGMLELPLKTQALRLQQLEERAKMAEAAHRAKLAKEAENDSNGTRDSKTDGTGSDQGNSV
jgi:hypothetical protein